MSRIYPSGSGSQQRDEVDMMVMDIEDDIKRFTKTNDEFVREMYGTNGNMDNVRSSSSLPLPSSSVYSKQSAPQNLNQQHGREEMIKLSHELAVENMSQEDNKRVAEDLKAQFAILAEQIKEYKNLNIHITKKLKASESKVQELESKVDTLEDEAQELRNNGDSKQSNPSGLYTVHHSNNNRQNAQLNRDLNKRTEQMRKALLSGENDEVAALSLNEAMASKNYFKMFKAWAVQYLPFKRDLRTVQARFGTSVASYFVFQRFVFLKLAAVAVVMVAFAIYHLSMFYQSNGTLSGYIQGPGYLPRFMMFSSFRVQEKFVYAAVVVLTMVFISVFLCASIVSEHKNAIMLEALESENRAPFSKEVLCAWDLSLQHTIDIDDLRGKNEHTYLQLLEDRHESGEKKARSSYESFVFVARRVLGIFLYIVVVTCSFSAIILLTVYGSIISDRAKHIPGVNNIGTLIAPLSLQVINAIVPMLLQAITHLEHWDSAQTELRFLLFRVYLSNTLNTLILTLSYIILSDPFALAQYPQLRRSLELVQNDTFSCRVDQAADGLFVLVGATWAIQLASFFGSPYMNKLFFDVQGKPWVKTEFNIAEAMVSKLSFLGIVYVAFPFAPLAMVFVPCYIFITFKWEKYVIKRYYAKPKRPFRGEQAALLYAVFYLCTYILVGMSVSGYFITTKTMAKHCDIQDEYVHLCLDPTLSSDDICAVDSSNIYYRMWGKTGTYPANLCHQACGPFVQERSAVSAFKDAVLGVGTLSTIWDIIFVYPYVPWAAVVVLAVVVATRVNLFEVNRFSSSNKERALENQIQGIEAERKRQEKIILKLKTIEEEDPPETDDI